MSPTNMQRMLRRFSAVSQRIALNTTNSIDKQLPQLSNSPTDLSKEILKIHSKYPDHCLFVQVGSFYEIYDYYGYLDEVSSLLNIKIASRDSKKSNLLRFAGFPAKEYERYARILLKNNKSVVLVNQTGKDLMSSTKKMSRSVVRIFTPGTEMSADQIEIADNQFLLSISAETDHKISLSWMDVTTGEFFVATSTIEQLPDWISRIKPREIIYPTDLSVKLKSLIEVCTDNSTSTKLTSVITCNESAENLKQFVSANFSMDALEMRLGSPISVEPSMTLDSTALKTLEIVSSIGGKTLFQVLNKTVTSAGGRLLKSRLVAPSLNPKEINRRLNLLEFMATNLEFLQQLVALLSKCKDIERYLQRLAFNTGGPSDLFMILDTIDTFSKVRSLISTYCEVSDSSKGTCVSDLEELLEKSSEIDQQFIQQFNSIISSEFSKSNKFNSLGIIADGISKDLDQLRFQLNELNETIETLEQTTSHEFGFPVKFKIDRTEGPCMQIDSKHSVTTSSSSGSSIKMIRNQSSQKVKRYYHSTYSEICFKIRECQDRLLLKEKEVFDTWIDKLLKKRPELTRIAQTIAELDVAAANALVANDRGYSRPLFTTEPVLEISSGRHPVVEQVLNRKSRDFTANDCLLESSKQWIITGPNSGGKSTFLRMCALIVVMAQAGMFVPASKARVGLVDSVLCRMGSADNLSENKSTFMVEMQETANILRNATRNSLVILDEVGRGTSYEDGLALSFSISKYLSENVCCRCLFATHCHQLADLLVDHQDISFYHSKILQFDENSTPTFVHKIEKGVMRNSHGILIAQIAGLPLKVLEDAKRLKLEL